MAGGRALGGKREPAAYRKEPPLLKRGLCGADEKQDGGNVEPPLNALLRYWYATKKGH